jgi:hypothetical protein
VCICTLLVSRYNMVDIAMSSFMIFMAMSCQICHMCTALQAVPLGMPSADWQECRPAAFEWSEGSGRVFAAGGTQPRHIYVWDAKQESCAQEVGVLNPPWEDPP